MKGAPWAKRLIQVLLSYIIKQKLLLLIKGEKVVDNSPILEDGSLI